MADRVRVGHPSALILVRHAESAGNVANAAALASGLEELDLATRDMDVPLSDLGERQAVALGRRLRVDGVAVDSVWCSPYRRALQTAAIALAEAGIDAPLTCDERLREREFGILDRLTKAGITARHPEQAAARAFLGKFFHRPPGGESWADIAGRVRGVVTALRLDHAGDRVLVIAHQAVITVFRYVLEGLSEAEVLAVDAGEELLNTAICTYEGDGLSAPHRVAWNDATHLPAELRSAAPDVPVVPR